MANAFLEETLRPNWPELKVELIEEAVIAALENSTKRIEAIASIESEHSYENTLKAFDEATELLDKAWGRVAHLDSVSNSEALRKIYNELLPRVSEFSTKIYINEKLWESIQAFSQTDEAKSLETVKKRHLDEVVKDFEESGALLDTEGKKKLEGINAELAQLTQKFSENVLDATNAWELVIDNEYDLKGLPETAKTLAREDALSKGYGDADNPKWRITLHAPSMMPVMQYLESDAIRKKVWEASSAVGYEEPYDNTEIIKKILRLRQDKAELLGEKDFADWVIKRRMAKSGKRALDFLEELHEKTLKFFHKEIEALELYKAEKTNQPRKKFQPWELGFWAEKQRKELYDFDEEQLRPYFNVESVVNGMYEIVQRLYGITIEEDSSAPVWHEDVQYYNIKDRDGTHLGSFYADWYPRETKRAGAWMNYLHTGIHDEPSLGLMCGNMTKPTKDSPALLTHREVETIFHEFGHLLHHLLGEGEVKSLIGIHVVWDFVELPSQIMENWCWERESLDLFARHYETGETIPEELFQKMLAARNYLSGIAMMRQLSISKMDLDLHIHYQGSGKELDAFIDEALEGYLIEYETKPPTIARRMGHLFSDSTGYAAGYYSYKWAEVLDADAFTKFKQEGLLSEKVGLEFREKILKMGNTRDADELFQDFMGRKPRLDSLLERSGLVEKLVESESLTQ